MPSKVLVVGSGISAAAACAVLKKKWEVTVLEQRTHIGGNCYDTLSQGTFIHMYGCHAYHNPNAELHAWTEQFTEWVPYRHTVTAEIHGGRQVPFPYSKETEVALGRSLGDEEIIETFFKGYSQKMWGKSWEFLPAAIRNRVPKRQEVSDFFPGQITALPKKGYTHFMENMFDGCDILVGVDPHAWQCMAQEFSHVIYCGRLDVIKGPGGVPIGSAMVNREKMITAWLEHVTLRFDRGTADPVSPTAVLNYCHLGHPAIRRVQHSQLTGGTSRAYHIETPVHHVLHSDLTPIYPVTSESTPVVLEYLKAKAQQLYPNLHPLGRIASHQYLDIFQAIAVGRKLGLELCAGAA